MPDVLDIVAHCPKCAEPYTIGRTMAGAGQIYAPDCTVTCPKCAAVYIASWAVIGGSLAPVSIFLVPTAGAGLDALLL